MRINWDDQNIIAVVIIIALLFMSIIIGQLITGPSYKFAIAFILVSAVFIATLINTDAGLAVLIFSMLLSPEIILGRVPGRDIVIRFDDFLLAVITFVWLAKTALNKGLALFIKTPLNKAIGVYLSVCIIATLKGAAQGYVSPPTGLFYIMRYIEYFLLYVLVANHVHSKKQIKFFLTAFFITCALVSVYGTLQIPSGKRVSAPFEGEIGEPNTFGGYLLFILCLAIGLFLQNFSQKLKIYLAGLAVLIVPPFLYTLSRASYVGIIFSFIAFIILSKKKFVLISMMVTAIIIIIILRPEAVFSRVKYTFQEREARLVKIGSTYLDQSSSARVTGWKDSFRAWKKNPILGRGITGLGFIDGQYIRTLPELGIVGFFAFLWLLWSILKHSVSSYKQMDDDLYKGLTLGFIAGFIGLVIHAITANTFIIIRIMEPFWFVAAIIMMMPTLREEEKRGIEEEKENVTQERNSYKNFNSPRPE